MSRAKAGHYAALMMIGSTLLTTAAPFAACGPASREMLFSVHSDGKRQTLSFDTKAGGLGQLVANKRKETILKGCQDVENGDTTGPGANWLPLLPAVLKSMGHRWNANAGSYNVPSDVLATIRSSVLEGPKHGAVSLVNPENHIYNYQATDGYVGQDKVVFRLEVAGRQFRFVISLLVDQTIQQPRDDEESLPRCSKLKSAAVIDDTTAEGPVLRAASSNLKDPPGDVWSPKLDLSI